MTIIDITQYISAGLLVAGGVFSLLAAVGVVRLPDLYTRMHAASKAGVVGAGLALLAAGLAAFDPAIALRAMLGICFLLLTTPVSAHLLARAAYITGIRPGPETSINDLEKPESNNRPN
jgi:multicomponent Na+:H+ antiporter subunit G